MLLESLNIPLNMNLQTEHCSPTPSLLMLGSHKLGHSNYCSNSLNDYEIFLTTTLVNWQRPWIIDKIIGSHMPNMNYKVMCVPFRWSSLDRKWWRRPRNIGTCIMIYHVTVPQVFSQVSYNQEKTITSMKIFIIAFSQNDCDKSKKIGVTQQTNLVVKTKLLQ